MTLLFKLDAEVAYFDPHFPSFQVMYNYDFEIQRGMLPARLFFGSSVVSTATNREAFDYDFTKKHAEITIDVRGVYRTLYSKFFWT